jgi:hypothetical protein
MLLLLPTYLVAYLPTINLYRFFRSTLTPHRHYRREASKHTAKPYDALAVGLDYILSTCCPKALRTHNHLVSEPSSLRGSLAADCPYPLRFYLWVRPLTVFLISIYTEIVVVGTLRMFPQFDYVATYVTSN